MQIVIESKVDVLLEISLSNLCKYSSMKSVLHEFLQVRRILANDIYIEIYIYISCVI